MQYAPRIIATRNYLAKEFKPALDKKDWAAVSKAYEIEKQAPDASMRNNPQRFINRFEKYVVCILPHSTIHPSIHSVIHSSISLLQGLVLPHAHLLAEL